MAWRGPPTAGPGPAHRRGRLRDAGPHRVEQGGTEPAAPGDDAPRARTGGGLPDPEATHGRSLVRRTVPGRRAGIRAAPDLARRDGQRAGSTGIRDLPGLRPAPGRGRTALG